MSPRAPFFDSDGSCDVAFPRGKTHVIAERGTEYSPTVLSMDVPATGALAIDIAIKRWSDLQERGW